MLGCLCCSVWLVQHPPDQQTVALAVVYLLSIWLPTVWRRPRLCDQRLGTWFRRNNWSWARFWARASFVRFIRCELQHMKWFAITNLCVVKIHCCWCYCRQAVWTSDRGQRLQVAAKVLEKERLENQADFLKEVTNMHGVEHRNIVRLYGVVLESESLKMVRQLVDVWSCLVSFTRMFY